MAIARAFANDPDLILADEPTGNLDPSLSDDILTLLDAMNQERGTTIVMVTHSPEAAAGAATCACTSRTAGSSSTSMR